METLSLILNYIQMVRWIKDPPSEWTGRCLIAPCFTWKRLSSGLKRQLNQLFGKIICALLFRFGAERDVPITIGISRVPNEDAAI